MSLKPYKFFIMRQNSHTMKQFIAACRDEANKYRFGKPNYTLVKCIIICDEILKKLLQDNNLVLCNAISEVKFQAAKILCGSAATN